MCMRGIRANLLNALGTRKLVAKHKPGELLRLAGVATARDGHLRVSPRLEAVFIELRTHDVTHLLRARWVAAPSPEQQVLANAACRPIIPLQDL
eukprot:2445553-Pleurochrysis_carterae.AAC.1